jgi:hypothetical protein
MPFDMDLDTLSLKSEMTYRPFTALKNFSILYFSISYKVRSIGTLDVNGVYPEKGTLSPLFDFTKGALPLRPSAK